jgi:hypothetical protein
VRKTNLAWREVVIPLAGITAAIAAFIGIILGVAHLIK